jgi:hypothetical protein
MAFSPIQPPVLTNDEIRKRYFPANLKCPDHRFVSQKENIVVSIPSRMIELHPTLAINDGNGGVRIIDRMDIGSYRIQFNGKYYVTRNKLEYQHLMGKPGIVCLGPVETQEVVKPVKEKRPWDKKE